MWHLVRVSDDECVLSTTDKVYCCEEYLEYLYDGEPVRFEYEELAEGRVVWTVH